MKNNSVVIRFVLILGIFLVIFVMNYKIFADDWPRFRGKNGTGISLEKGLMQEWPKDGPELIWSVNQDLGKGYSSPVISNKKLFITGMIKGEGFLFAFNLEGKLLWRKGFGLEWKDAWGGSRSSPTVAGTKVYVLSGIGKLICFSVKTGAILWSRNPAEEYESIKTEWGWAESPLIFEDMIICTPAGKKTTMVAFNRHTGKTIWKSGSLGEQHAYCSAVKIKRGNFNIIINRTEHILFGIDVKTGKLLWKYDCTEFMKPAKPPQIHPNPPIYQGGCLYITSGYDAGGAKFLISKDGKSIRLIWTDKTLDVFHGGAVLVNDQLFGANYNRKKKPRWIALDWKTGKKLGEMNWNNRQGVTLYADNRLYCFEEKTGEVRLITADPSFVVKGSFKIPFKQSKNYWSHSAISDGFLYIRHQNQLFCYNVKK